MGMTIDEKCYLYGSCKCQTAGCVVRPDNGCPVYRYFKDLIVKDYETRLKADIVAILTELQLEIEDLYPEHLCTGELTGFADAIETITPIIQQKINALKGEPYDKRTAQTAD